MTEINVFHNVIPEQMRKLEESEKARREAEEAAEAARREMEDREGGMTFENCITMPIVSMLQIFVKNSNFQTASKSSSKVCFSHAKIIKFATFG